jgi:hypothetical protein
MAVKKAALLEVGILRDDGETVGAHTPIPPGRSDRADRTRGRAHYREKASPASVAAWARGSHQRAASRGTTFRRRSRSAANAKHA